jgi:hypothetical protein
MSFGPEPKSDQQKTNFIKPKDVDALKSKRL